MITAGCQFQGLKLNTNKTHPITISKSCTLNPPHPCLQVIGEQIEDDFSIRLLGVTLYSEGTYVEKQIRSLSFTITQEAALLCKCLKKFSCESILIKSIYAFILSLTENSSPVWGFAANGHLILLDRAIN